MPLLLRITAIILFFLLFVFIYLKDRKKTLNRTYSLIVLTGFIWVSAVLLADIDVDRAFFWSQLSILGPIWIPPFFLFFSIIFPEEKAVINNIDKTLIFSPSILLSLLIFSPYNIKSISIEDWGTNYQPGILYFFVFALFLIYLAASLKILIGKYRKLQGYKKSQILIILVAIFLAVLIGFIFNLFIPLVFSGETSTYGATLSSVVFLLFTSYAIYKYKLMEIKIVASEILGISLIVFSFLQVFQILGNSLLVRAFIFFVTLIIALLFIRSIILETKRLEEMKQLNNKLEKATTDLQTANKELQRLDDAKSEFLSIASHQLRTPVTIIKGYVSMIIEGSYGKISKKITGVLKNVSIANDRLLNLIENLLDISRIEAGRLEFDLKEIDLVEVVRPIVIDFQQKAKAKGLKLQFFESEKIAKVVADNKKISEVISNILDNSIKYTPRGEVNVGLHQEGASVVFVCQDTGLGIEPDDLPRLFHKFVRGKDMMKVHTEGTGLGMYFARTVVENMGGRIWAESPGKNRGSKFCFSLPLANKKKATKINASANAVPVK